MRITATAAQLVVRFGGLHQLVTGTLFWTGNGLAWLPVHMLVGLVLSLALEVLAALAAWAGVHPGRVVLAVLWGLAVPVLGLTQSQLLPGDLHWLVQALHLLVGLGAMAQAEALAARIKPAAPAGTRPGTGAVREEVS
ncbi:MAG TPA: hypothetical protein VG370_24940 [Chloroflexota bacterium]|jgi:hypothetical protein|nr:hypothetical protein [Chloroflexota bacterium]